MGFLLAAISLLVLQAGQAVSAESISDLCLAGGAILQEQCSPLIALHIHGQTSTCCNTLKGLHDLGCFCDEQISKVVPQPELWDFLALCGREVETDGDILCLSRKSGESESLSTQVEMSLNSLEDGLELQLLADDNKVVDFRPVLDLSEVPDTVTTVFQRSNNGQVTIRYTERLEEDGDTSFSVDLELPDTADLDIGLTYSVEDGAEAAETNSEVYIETLEREAGMLQDEAQAGDIITLDAQYLQGLTEPSVEGSAVEVVEANAGNEVHPCKQRVSEEVSQPGSLEVSIGLPESFFEAFKQSDVTIDMEYNAEADTFNSAAVTLDDGVQETSFNGQAIGSLLNNAAQFLSSELAIPLSAGLSGNKEAQINAPAEKDSLLKGALTFLAAVGEDIRDSIPDKQLHDGDVIQIQHDEDDIQEGLLVSDSLQNPARRYLDKFSDAVRSAMSHSARGNEEVWIGACSVCDMVHRYLYVLWGVIVAGIAALAYCIVSAGLRVFTHYAPTNPNEELQQPLIVCAADYVRDRMDGQTVLLPVWSPPNSLQKGKA